MYPLVCPGLLLVKQNCVPPIIRFTTNIFLYLLNMSNHLITMTFPICYVHYRKPSFTVAQKNTDQDFNEENLCIKTVNRQSCTVGETMLTDNLFEREREVFYLTKLSSAKFRIKKNEI